MNETVCRIEVLCNGIAGCMSSIRSSSLLISYAVQR